jgi:ankyrin repeat protein
MKLLEAWLAWGEDPNEADHWGYTALHAAAMRDNLKAAKLLAAFGGKGNVPGANRKTAMGYNKSQEMKNCLISSGLILSELPEITESTEKQN